MFFCPLRFEFFVTTDKCSAITEYDRIYGALLMYGISYLFPHGISELHDLAMFMLGSCLCFIVADW